jgi:hypothetical protein
MLHFLMPDSNWSLKPKFMNLLELFLNYSLFKFSNMEIKIANLLAK